MKRTEKATKARQEKLFKQWEDRLQRMGLGLRAEGEDHNNFSYMGLLSDMDRKLVAIAKTPDLQHMDSEIACVYGEDLRRKQSVPQFTRYERAQNDGYYLNEPALLRKTEIRLKRQAPGPYEPHPGNRLGRHAQEESRDGKGLADRLRLRVSAEGGRL